MSQTFHCPSCGGPLDFDGGNAPTLRCPYCRSSAIIPVLFALSTSGWPLEALKLRINPIAPAQLVTSIGGEGIGPGLFTDPRTIAVASDGTLFISEYSGGRVQHLAADGSSLDLWNIGKGKYVSYITR